MVVAIWSQNNLIVPACRDGVASSASECPQAGNCFYASTGSDSEWSLVASGQLILVLIAWLSELEEPGEDASMLVVLVHVVEMASTHSIGEMR